MTPEAQGAVERAAEVLAAHRLHDRRSDPRYPWCICGWEPERGGTGNERIYYANLRHIAEALAAANLLATPPTASHDETVVMMNGVRLDRYTDGDVNHVLQPVIGWWRLLHSRGEQPDGEAIGGAIDRMVSACESERKWLRTATPPTQERPGD